MGIDRYALKKLQGICSVQKRLREVGSDFFLLMSPEEFDYLDQSRIRSEQGRMKFYVF